MTFKVAHVIRRFNSGSGGPPRVVVAIARAGITEWQSDLFTTGVLDGPSDSLLVAEFPGAVHLIDERASSGAGGWLEMIGISKRLRGQLRRAGPQIVHLHGLWSPLLAAYARICRAAGIPYIVAPHGMLEPWSLTVNPTRKRLALRSYQGSVLDGAAAIHTTSDAEAEQVRRLGFGRKPIFVIPNAIEEPVPGAATAPRPADPRVLLFLSRLHEKKGLDNLLAAWNDVRPAGWQLKIVGQGEAAYVDHLKRLSATLGAPRVEFHDHVDGERREAMFAAASAFVLPTFSENFGNAVAEATLRGLPVITTTGTPWSIIRERELGWYIEPTRPSIAAALRALASAEADSLSAMGHRAQAYARDNFLLAAVRPKLAAMYSAALPRGTP